MKNNWPRVPLGNVLRKSERWIRIQSNETYKLVTVRLWGKGVALRGQVAGVEIAASEMLQVRPNQFILSRIDARNGAFGLIPDSLDGAIVSNDFPVFDIEATCLLPAFIGWMSKTKDFVDFCKAASEGTTNRVRLKEDRFLGTAIPLPPLEEQRRIVAKIDELAAKIEEANHVRRQARQEAEALPDSMLTEILRKASSERSWELGPIPMFAEVNPSRTGQVNLSMDDPVSFVPMKAVDDVTGTIVRPETRPFAEAAKGYTWFKEGDVIFARITPCMQNGKAAIARNLVNGIGFGSTEFHVMRPGPKLLAEWLYALVRHKSFRDDAARQFKGTAGQQRVPQSFLDQKVIPVPPLLEQRQIIAELNSLKGKVEDLKNAQARTAGELDSLKPSILDKAYKGEL